MPKHRELLVLRLCLFLAILCAPFQAALGQTAITTFNTSTQSATSSTTLVTSPSDASNSVSPNTQYNINYGGGNDVFVDSYTIGSDTYDNFLQPDTLVIRRTDGSRFINIWYSLTNIDTGPNPDEINLVPTQVSDADAIYQSGILNGGYDNILVNDDDLAGASIQAQTERVDLIWYSGLTTSSPTTAVFPVIERGGNDNIKVAAITALDGNGDPSSYTSLVTISSGAWTGGTVSVGTQMILRRQVVGQDPIPILNNSSQNVEGVAVSFDDLGVTANQIVYGFSIFASDVVEPTHDLVDFTTFPNTTLSSVSGLDLVAGLAAAVASDDELIETVGPGGYKSALTTWLKANDGAFVTSGGAASTEGDNVGFWEDQAVGNYDFITLGTAPTFRSTTSDINFNPTVDFISGAERGLQVADNEDYNVKSVNDGYTNKGINIAFRTSSSNITTKQQLYEEGGGSNGLGIYISGGNVHLSVWNRGSQAQGDWNDDAGGVETVSASVATNTEYIITMEFAGDGSGSKNGSITGYLNGQSMGSVTDPFSQGVGLLYNHGGDIGLGQHDGASAYDDNFTEGDDFYGEIAEFIYCNEPASFALSTRQQIESYLAIKYGITLDQSTAYNYVNSNGDVIFNTTDAASIGGYLEYHHDIAGIGRDDDSELLQLQSRSENNGSIVTIGKGAIGTDDTWLIWGNDEASTSETALLTMPDTIDMRVERVWRVAEEGEIGPVDISFDLTELGLSTSDASIYSLIVAGNSSNADFSSATVITGGTINSGTITFTGVSLEDGQYFTLGTDFMICSPGGVETDLALWYKADAGTNTTVDAADVTSWADQSVNGNNASETNGGGTPEEPTYRTGVANYNPAIRFTDPGGTNWSYLRSSSNPATDDMTLISVFATTQNQGTSNFYESPNLIGGDEGTVNGATASLGLSTGNLFGKIKADDDINNSTVDPATSNDGIFKIGSVTRVRGASGALELYLNSENVDSGTSDNTQTNLSTAVGIGNSDVGFVDAQYAGDIAETIIFADDLDSDELNRVESYLAIRYGITRAGSDDIGTGAIDERDYRRSDGTAVWDYDVRTSTYYNDIGGIGRDDQSCYEQRQSAGVNSDDILAIGLGTIAADNASNPNSFSSDGDFLVWGSDNDFTDQANANTSDLPSGVTERMERIWNVQETGTVGNTTLEFDLNSLGYSSTVTDFQLIVSNSATMSGGTLTPAASLVGGILTFNNIDLSNGQFFTIATGREVCSPGGVSSGLLLSLRADAGVTGTSNVTAWEDQSLSGTDASATTGPELISDGINYNPSLDFNGSNETMAITNGILGTTSPNDLIVFAVTEVDVVQNSWLFYEELASSERFGSHLPWSDANAYYDYPNATPGSGRVSGAWGGTTGNANIWTLFSSTSSFTTSSGSINKGIFRDGTLIASNTSSITGTGDNNDFNIASDGSNFYDAEITEILVYNSAPTTQELEQIQTYFAIKYGIFKNSPDIGSTGAVDERDYFRSDATVIWDQSVNSSYHQDVAGIGRDDLSCLNQKQSSSEGTDDIVAIGLGGIAADNASNVNSFVSDGDFMVWGNDGAAREQASANTSDVPGIVSERMSRIWKVQETGTVGNTSVSFDLTGLGYSSTASDFQLIISGTSTMADGNTFAGGTFNGSVLTFDNIDFADGDFFTLGTAITTCGPGGVSTNLEVWYKADAGTSTTTDGADLTGATAWLDQSPNANNGAESDLGGGTPVEPTYETNEINFNPVVRFIDPNSTNSSYIETSTFTEPGDDFTLISLFQSGQDQGTLDDFVNTPALIGGSETSSSDDYGLGFYQGQVIINANTTSVFDATTTSTYNDNEPHIALATRDQSSGAVEIFMNGISDATGTGSTATLDGATTLGFGNHSDGDVQAQFNGDIAETIVYSSVLTGEEQSRVESYLAIKWGLTISNNRDNDGSTNELISGSIREGDYVAADGGIIWDHLNQGPTYHNDIFGIGRDDLSCLDQTQSKSENSDAMVTFNYSSGFSNNDSWLISGNDNAAIEAPDNPERPDGINSRLNREWRVQETGTVGQIELTYDLSSVTGTPFGDNNLNLVRLMVDDDGDFTNGPTLIAPNSIDGGAQTVTFLVDFTDGQYYTLGSTEVNALPITLISFDTRATTDNKVEVSWATAQEINNSFFTIERSRDGINFEPIGFKEGAGNSVIIIDYTYVDEEPLDGVSYYRLKQTDFSGEFEYSEVSKITLDLPESSVHQVVPNPVGLGHNFKVTYPVKTPQDVRISIANANGISTYNKVVRVIPEQGEIEVSTTGLAKGLYFIKIVDQQLNHITLKFIVN